MLSARGKIFLTKNLFCGDESIVWYGNIDFLAYGRKDSGVLRFENADIAGDLLELVDSSEAQLTLNIWKTPSGQNQTAFLDDGKLYGKSEILRFPMTFLCMG